MDRTGVIILAGGNSTRFGKAKPFLKLSSGLTFSEHLIRTYEQFGCKEIVLVLNKALAQEFEHYFNAEFRATIKIVYNSRTDLGRFYSLRLGAEAITNSDYIFIQNIDNPFTDLDTLQTLNANRKPHAYISPIYGDRGGHPVLVPQLIIDMVRKVADNNTNIKEFLNQFTKIAVKIETDLILANINTPKDYQEMFPEAH